MNLKPDSQTCSYLPVAWDYRETIEEEKNKETSGKIFYFCAEEGICEAKGKIEKTEEDDKQGIFVILENSSRIRIDRIITLFGKPGAAYDEYDAYSNACMSCLGGYEKEDL